MRILLSLLIFFAIMSVIEKYSPEESYSSESSSASSNTSAVKNEDFTPVPTPENGTIFFANSQRLAPLEIKTQGSADY